MRRGGHERGDGAARDERAQTWWGWVTGAEVAEVPKAVDVGGEIALTPEQRAMLSALLAPPEESAAAAAAGEAEAEYVEHELKVSLDAVSIALVEHHSAAVVSAGDVAPEHQEIAQMAVRRLYVCIAKRCAGLRGRLSWDARAGRLRCGGGYAWSRADTTCLDPAQQRSRGGLRAAVAFPARTVAPGTLRGL